MLYLLLFHCNNGCTNVCLLRCTYSACLVITATECVYCAVQTEPRNAWGIQGFYCDALKLILAFLLIHVFKESAESGLWCQLLRYLAEGSWVLT